MQRKPGLGIGNVLTVLAFFIGLGGVIQLIRITEAGNNAVTAFAAVSIALALLAGFLAWVAPSARWRIGITMSAPRCHSRNPGIMVRQHVSARSGVDNYTDMRRCLPGQSSATSQIRPTAACPPVQRNESRRHR